MAGKYLTPTGRPRKRWVRIPCTDGTEDRWLLEVETLDLVKALIPTDDDSEAVCIILESWYHNESIDKTRARLYHRELYPDDPHGH